MPSRPSLAAAFLLVAIAGVTQAAKPGPVIRATDRGDAKGVSTDLHVKDRAGTYHLVARVFTNAQGVSTIGDLHGRFLSTRGVVGEVAVPRVAFKVGAGRAARTGTIGFQSGADASGSNTDTRVLVMTNGAQGSSLERWSARRGDRVAVGTTWRGPKTSRLTQTELGSAP